MDTTGMRSRSSAAAESKHSKENEMLRNIERDATAKIMEVGEFNLCKYVCKVSFTAVLQATKRKDVEAQTGKRIDVGSPFFLPKQNSSSLKKLPRRRLRRWVKVVLALMAIGSVCWLTQIHQTAINLAPVALGQFSELISNARSAVASAQTQGESAQEAKVIPPTPTATPTAIPTHTPTHIPTSITTAAVSAVTLKSTPAPTSPPTPAPTSKQHLSLKLGKKEEIKARQRAEQLAEEQRQNQIKEQAEDEEAKARDVRVNAQKRAEAEKRLKRAELEREKRIEEERAKTKVESTGQSARCSA